MEAEIAGNPVLDAGQPRAGRTLTHSVNKL